MSRLLVLTAVAFTAGTALGAPHDQPWSIVESGNSSETRMEAHVAITRIDGESTRNQRGGDALAPGKHTVRVRFDTAKAQQSEDEKSRDLDLELAPCTRYRIVAKRTKPTGLEWEPKVYTEKIGECARKFK